MKTASHRFSFTFCPRNGGGSMRRDEDIKRAVGKADAYELLSCVFAYPDERIAQGLVDGSLVADAYACLADAGACEDEASRTAEALSLDAPASAETLLGDLRSTYSRLFLAPGGRTPIFPYESAFLHVESGASGAPALFRTPVTLDVEAHMREAGVVAKNARKEPCDSVSEECEFLSYLYAKLADAVVREAADDEAAWADRIDAFERAHAHAWLPLFMERTQELAGESPYAGFAAFGLAVLDRSPDAQKRKEVRG